MCEVRIVVTLQVEPDLGTDINEDAAARFAKEAIEHAVKMAESNGFEHSGAYDVSIGVVSIEPEQVPT